MLIEELFVRLVTSDRESQTLPYVIVRNPVDSISIRHFEPNSNYKKDTVCLRLDQLYLCLEEVYEDEYWNPKKWKMLDPFLYHVYEHVVNRDYHPGSIVSKNGDLFVSQELNKGTMDMSKWKRAHHLMELEVCSGHMNYGNGDFKQFDFSGMLVKL
ncbi:hypothetical protein [Vibrio phage BONAISHI]|nr:hypothetical protein [Vibrio phage BONAISHI]